MIYRTFYGWYIFFLAPGMLMITIKFGIFCFSQLYGSSERLTKFKGNFLYYNLRCFFFLLMAFPSLVDLKVMVKLCRMQLIINIMIMSSTFFIGLSYRERWQK